MQENKSGLKKLRNEKGLKTVNKLGLENVEKKT